MSKIAVIGAGLVGPAISVFLARSGHQVILYEKGQDPSKVSALNGRSINLAISERGWSAIKSLGAEKAIRDISIAMHGRMVHHPDGNLSFQPYGAERQAIYSVPRELLNSVLLDCTRTYPNIECRFMHACLGVDQEKAEIRIQDIPQNRIFTDHADLIIGADGNNSVVRSVEQFPFKRNYIDYGYKEISVGDENNRLGLAQNALHIWPRGNFMLIALPNANGSFTFTLFLPFCGETSFETMQTAQDWQLFCKTFFPDLLASIPSIVEVFVKNKEYSLYSISCDTWHYKDKVMLLGDAAHGILPFYGQGANMGLEDCMIFHDIMLQPHNSWEDIFTCFFQRRKPDADAIAELSLQNFREMRDKVADPQFQLRKKIEAHISRQIPQRWTPLYSMIAFSRTPYAEALHIARWQEAIMDTILQIENIGSIWEQLDYGPLIDEMKQHFFKYQKQVL